MGGDVVQWNEGIISSEYRVWRGGSEYDFLNTLSSSYRSYSSPMMVDYNVGFRVAASVPEPSTIGAFLLASAACLLGYAGRRRKMGDRTLMVGALASVLAMTASVSQAQGVFNMPNGEASLSFVPVGDPGNAPDPATGSLYGSVGYAYDMGKYDVTMGQYCEFLNAVAATDTYGLYNSYMALGGYAGYYPTVGIAGLAARGTTPTRCRTPQVRGTAT